MTAPAVRAAPPSPAKPTLRERIAAHRAPQRLASLTQLCLTLGLWLGLWTVLVLGPSSLFLRVPVTLLTALFTVRLFILQHDCGHGSFFASRRLNEWVGSVLGVLTMTPFQCWRRQHAYHHAHNGRLDRRGIGDIDTMTIEEYQAKSPSAQRWYRFYRHPLFLFGPAPILQLAVKQRLTSGLPKAWKRERASVHWTSLGLLALIAGLGLELGWNFVLLTYLPVMAIAASVGVWLFYVQHQFEPTYWDQGKEWDYQAAALEGSSFYDLPRALHWVTGYIGYHHIHHLDSCIPNYRLPQVHREHPELLGPNRLGLLSSLRCANLKLWDPERRRMVGFRQARQTASAGDASSAQ